MGGVQMQAAGRVTAQGVPMRLLVMRALNVTTSDELAGLPSWADTERFDITAKAPATDPTAPALDAETLAPMLRGLLADRFKMTYHTEERQVAAYSLVAAKPKLKKADPASRASCKFPNPQPPGTPPGSRVMTCQNVSMSQFADRLQRLTPELMQPVLDVTELEGGWDLTLTFNPTAGMMMGPISGGPGGAQAASDPSGSYTIFEAMEKQLGLKLEKQKRPMQVFVIDHIEQKPTDN
jgi:uncharacterized protein (TIGR03435 family)